MKNIQTNEVYGMLGAIRFRNLLSSWFLSENIDKNIWALILPIVLYGCNTNSYLNTKSFTA
jgi:hypothetical protein